MASEVGIPAAKQQFWTTKIVYSSLFCKFFTGFMVYHSILLMIYHSIQSMFYLTFLLMIFLEGVADGEVEGEGLAEGHVEVGA